MNHKRRSFIGAVLAAVSSGLFGRFLPAVAAATVTADSIEVVGDDVPYKPTADRTIATSRGLMYLMPARQIARLTPFQLEAIRKHLAKRHGSEFVDIQSIESFLGVSKDNGPQSLTPRLAEERRQRMSQAWIDQYVNRQ